MQVLLDAVNLIKAHVMQLTVTVPLQIHSAALRGPCAACGHSQTLQSLQLSYTEQSTAVTSLCGTFVARHAAAATVSIAC